MKALPRHHLRVPDERARLRADEGDARVARLRARCPSATDADLILFNTCSIREKADDRFVAHLREATRAQGARPRAGDRRRRLLGAVGQGAGLPPVPVRRRRLRPRPGAQARGVPDLGLAHRPGLLRVRGLHRPPARQAGARVPGLGADLRRLQLRCSYCIVPSTRGAEVSRPLDELVAEVRAARRGRGARGDAAGPERQLLRARPAAAARELPRAAARAWTRSRGSARPLHEPAPARTCARTSILAHAELESRLRAHPPAAAVRLLAGPQGDAPDLHARALPGPRRADPRARARLRADHRRHRRLPGRDRGGLRARRSRSARRSATTAPSPSSSRRAAARRRRRSPTASWRTRSRSSAWSAWSRSSSAAPASAPSASSGGRWRCSSRAPRAPTRRACAAARRHNKVVNFEGLAAPGDLVAVEISAATSQTLLGEQASLLARA